jgi:hypothetical protein
LQGSRIANTIITNKGARNMTKTYTITAYYKEYFTFDVEANSIQEAKIKALDNQEDWEALQIPATGISPIIEDVEEVE